MKHLDRLKKHIKDSTCLSLIDRLSTRKLHLLPGEIDESLSNDIANLSLNKHSSQARSSIKAGLFQWNDDLDRSHDICQDIHSSTGSYWHGIMHRREPDYWNGKYWFRKVGGHPVYSELASTAISIAEELYSDNPDVMAYAEELCHSWDPYRFIDLCEEVESGSRPALRDYLEDIQVEEILLLLIFSASL